MGFDVKNIEDKPEIAIVYLKGRLDVHYSSEVETQINKLISEGKKKLVISLNDVEYLSSSGLRIFIAISRTLKEVNGQLKLIKLNETARKIFKIVELIDMFDIYESEEEAINSFM
ncbi:MAG: STAS domain-containing protein [Spirochaetes bacterium]|nr:STAS domain-containing protein [Spirochaetota bacterium]